ncbi:MAG: amidohydrolase family protein, partial [Dehalococcoidia bacterium]
MVLNDDWLNLTAEDPIELDIPIIDPHHHLWDYPDNRYALEEIVADTATHNVRQTVFIECSAMYRATGPDHFKPIGETEFVQGIAAMSASGRYGTTAVNTGIVGTADLRLGDGVVPVLEAQLAASPNRFRGVRHRAAWPERRTIPVGQPASMDHLLLDPDFRKGFRYLREYALSFEAWLFHPNIPDVADLARAFPDQTIILNHLGGPVLGGEFPGTNEEIFATWKRDITAVAQCPNVVLKVGGIQMPVNGFKWHERERPPTSDELIAVNAPWYMHSIEAFGPSRCMFESNFPVDRASCSYTVLWNQFKKLTKSFRADERAAMFAGTAARVYRLK